MPYKPASQLQWARTTGHCRGLHCWAHGALLGDSWVPILQQLCSKVGTNWEVVKAATAYLFINSCIGRMGLRQQEQLAASHEE